MSKRKEKKLTAVEFMMVLVEQLEAANKTLTEIVKGLDKIDATQKEIAEAVKAIRDKGIVTRAR